MYTLRKSPFSSQFDCTVRGEAVSFSRRKSQLRIGNATVDLNGNDLAYVRQLYQSDNAMGAAQLFNDIKCQRGYARGE